MPNNQESLKPGPEIVKMFRQSIAPFSKKLVALHPHLYGSLYRRASEIHALDKILDHLKEADQEAKTHRYTLLPPLLLAVKEALYGHPPLSWWNLFTASLGYAFRGGSEAANNKEELYYLNAISEILTGIIRNYQSPNTKLLLDIRLTALEVDTRIVELEKIPEGVQEVNQTLDYLVSEFQLLIQDLKKVVKLPKQGWSQSGETLLFYVEKVNRLMGILQNVELTDLQAHNLFFQQGHAQELRQGIELLIKEFTFQPDDSTIEFWGKPQLDALFELFDFFPDMILVLAPKEAYSFLQRAEDLFVADPSLDKVRPSIFSSMSLKRYVLQYALECKRQFEQFKAQAKTASGERGNSQVFASRLKNYFSAENDLHHLCSLVRFKQGDCPTFRCDTAQVQSEILNRMVVMANLAEPQQLDALLKSFSEEEKEGRYFLLQEVILEQFIRWRKQGIY